MRTNRLRTIVVLSAALLGSLLSAAPAGAANVKLNCTYTATMTITPGLSMTPGATAFGGTGTAACVRNGGGSYTGPVALSGSTSSIGTCVEGAGSGTFTATLATAGVPTIVLTGRFTFVRDGVVLQGPVTLTNNDSGFGTLAGVLLPGLGQTCVATPVTRATVAGTLQVTGQIS